MTPKPVNGSEIPHAAIVAQSLEELRIKTGSLDRLFQMGKAKWAFSQETGIITFTSPDGIVATAPAQFVGSYYKKDHTWLWAWDNASIEPKLRKHSEITRAYGEKQGIRELTTRKFETDVDKCWELAALTCKLADDQCVYCGITGDSLVFITFGEVTMKKGK